MTDAADGPAVPPGADPNDAVAAQMKAKSKTALKNAKRKEAKARAETEKEVDKVAELAALMGVTAPPTAPSVNGVSGGAPKQKQPKQPKGGKDTPAPTTAPAGEEKKDEVSEVEKKVRALKKKLKQTDELVAKQASGAELNADQLAKIQARAEIEAETKRWECLNDQERVNPHTP